MLRDAVAHLKDADIRRADKVYAGMATAATLRRCPGERRRDDARARPWVGQLRGAAWLPRPA